MSAPGAFEPIPDRPADGGSLDEWFGRLMREHGAALGRLVAAYATDADDRADLLQDIALAVWTALPRFRGDCSERTFLFRIGHNRGLSFRWRRRRAPEAIEDTNSVPDPGETPEASAMRSQQRSVLLGAVQRLPDVHRVVVMLGLEGLSNREIADIVGISTNNVAVRLGRARRMLKDLMKYE